MCYRLYYCYLFKQGFCTQKIIFNKTLDFCVRSMLP
ncbi:hypothetical protein ETECTG_CDS0177 [Escherichia phage ETEC-TG]|nr:hypothetical protein ETECTG_CDS0177 [Escherichia phage ETEC-TG]